MAEFPPNVYDAQLWLPSETFFNDVVPSSPLPPLLQSRVSSTTTDDIARRLAALTLLKQRRCLGLHLQRFRPPVRTGQLDCQYCQSYLPGLGNASGAYLPGTELYHHNPFPNPVQLPVSDVGLVEPRPRALSRLHNQVQIRNQNQNQNRILQFQGNGIAPMPGVKRVSGGTGVFHPRVVGSTTTMVAPEVKKKPGSKNRPENRGIQQRNSMNKCVNMGEENHQLCPDVILPQEWTY
ncbi:uncharacterized protein LOC126800332 [Argentina anserina]|uniref:uncharacterized protein LOC126800332 n=1 Tax=Argentina anserina TaxID=57926 RepID=UPI0021768811|nr:uncharacterized protein LOC126800332 [Potentilla anserina]